MGANQIACWEFIYVVYALLYKIKHATAFKRRNLIIGPLVNFSILNCIHHAL